jgi:uncharacterized protein (TIGR03437 family)
MSGIRSVIFFAALAASWVNVAQAAPPAGCGTNGTVNVGYQTLTLASPPAGSQYPGALLTSVWYPTTATESPFTYTSVISGSVAVNGPISDCGNGTTFPLIIFSHAWNGCAIQIVYYTEQLARLGYIVAAPNHEDAGCGEGSSIPGNPNDYFGFVNFVDSEEASVWMEKSNYRNVDVDNVVNYLLNTAPWNAAINPAKIGISGHSFGGYTSFAKIGGWLPWLSTTYTFQAGAMFSPYIQAFAENNDVGNPTVPMLFEGGELDGGITPCVMGPPYSSNYDGICFVDGPGAFQVSHFPANGGSKYFAEIGGSNSTHLAWVNTICGKNSTVQGCLENVPNAALIVNYAQAFFDRYVAGGSQYTSADAQLLASSGSGLYNYWRTAEVPGGTYAPGSPAAPLSIAALKGENLAPSTVQAAGTLSMPMSIEGETVTITSADGSGAAHPAALYAISPGQINFVVPSGLAAGYYIATAQDSTGNVIASGPLSINPVSPAFFGIPDANNANIQWGWGWTQQGYSANSTCQNQGGTQYCSIYSGSAAVPIGVSQGNTYLVLAATGLRFASNLQATVGSVSVPVVGVPSPYYEGIDQVNVGPLPASLAGTGQVNIVLTADGMQSNAITVVIQ